MYLVTFYGFNNSETYLLGIYDTEEMATKAMEKAIIDNIPIDKRMTVRFIINKIEPNKSLDIAIVNTIDGKYGCKSPVRLDDYNNEQR